MARSPLYDIYDPQKTLWDLDGEEELQPIGIIPFGQKPTLSDLMPEEKQDSMLRSLSEMGGSGLAGLGWLLDTPRAIIHGTISGLAEGDPLKGLRALGQTSDERVSGRDLLRQFGVAGPDDNWLNWGAGMALEMATDPLSYATLGLSALGKVGKAARVAKNAGLLDDVALLAKNQNKGVRQFLREMTPEELFKVTGDDTARAAFDRAAKGRGLDPTTLYDKSLGPMAEFRLPGTEIGGSVDFGPLGDFMAKTLDATGEALTRAPVIGPVVNRATAMFDANVMGAVDPDEQWIMRRASSAAKKGERAELERLGRLQWDAVRAGTDTLPEGLNSFSSRRIQNAIRDLVEAGGDSSQIIDQDAVNAIMNVPEWKRVYEDFASRGPEFYRRAQEQGLELGRWTGESGDRFFPSQSVWFDNPDLPDLPDRLARTPNPYSRGNRVLGLDENFSRPRKSYTDLPNRAQTFRQLMTGQFGRDLQDRLINASDDQIPDIIDQAFRDIGKEAPFQKGQKELVDFLADDTLIAADRKTYQSQLDKLIEESRQNKIQLGDLLRKADRQFSDQGLGLFDESAFNSMARYATGRARVEANAGVLTDELLKAAQDQAPGSFAGGGWLRLDEAAQQLGFDPASFKKIVNERLGSDITSFSVNEKLVESLKRLRPITDAAPDSMARKAWNTYTNAFKVGALANPAYHTRNAYSGYLASLFGGSDDAIGAAKSAYAGYQASKGNYEPLLNRLRTKDASGAVSWAAPGFEGLTDEQILQEVMAGVSRNRLSGGEFADMLGSEQTTKALFPGADNDPLTLFGKGGLLYDPERTWRDWATVRGVDWAGIFADREAPRETLNPFLQLHERVGKRVEDANRLGTYISQLRQGVAPDAAADMVYKTQIDYSPQAFTEFERKLKQYVPFYSYTRGIVPLAWENVRQRPGGMMGQTIRGITRASEPSADNFTPEHLRQSAAIPLPPELGGKPAENLQRYLTNIDIPVEGLFNLFSGGVGNTLHGRVLDSAQKTGLNLLGQLNPIIKTPLEMLLDRQLYTGRQLSDLHGSFERFVDPEYGDLAKTAEQILVNLPGGAKVNSIVRTALDDRLSVGDKALKLGFNNLAGLKFTDQDMEKARRLAARDMLNQLLEAAPGVKTYENITVPEEVLRAMPRQQQDQYLLFKILQAEAAKRARDKKKAETALDPLQVLGVLS